MRRTFLAQSLIYPLLFLSLTLPAPAAAGAPYDKTGAPPEIEQSVYVETPDNRPNTNTDLSGTKAPVTAAVATAGKEPGFLQSIGDALARFGTQVKETVVGAAKEIGAFYSELFSNLFSKLFGGDKQPSDAGTKPTPDGAVDPDQLSESHYVSAPGGVVLTEKQACARALEALSSGDEKLQGQALTTLIDIGDTKVLKPLKEEIAARRKAGEDVAVLEATLGTMEERIALRAQVEKTYGVKISDNSGSRFSTEQLRIIPRVLAAFPLKNDVKEITTDYRYVSGIASGGYSEGGIIGVHAEGISGVHGITFAAVLIHEFGHSVDNTSYDFNAFKDLNGASVVRGDGEQKYIDFARSYGATNQLEDFATMFEFYGVSTKTSFLEMIDRAEQGYPMALTKLLKVMDVVSAGEDTTVFYQGHGGTRPEDAGFVESLQVPVGRDDTGRIVTLGGVAIYREDGSFDLKGLKDYFTKLDFAEDLRQATPLSAIYGEE